jgi:uncharacterized protein YdeI (YjbR/CyaY-like superfamily)
MDAEILFFATPEDWRQWLAEHHAERREVWVGFYKKGSGRPSITWPEAVDQALCFGWIDSVRKRVDADSYTNRFTPRKRGSTWSNVNIKRVAELTDRGLMQPSGQAAFETRTAERLGIYSSEQREVLALDPSHEAQLRANPSAWAYFQARPSSYRKAAIWWIVSAKQEATRLRRLNALVECSEQGRTVPPLTRPGTENRGNAARWRSSAAVAERS